MKNKTNKVHLKTKKDASLWQKFLDVFQTNGASALEKHWNKIQPLCAKLKILNLNMNKYAFWTKLSLNWVKDVNEQGYLTKDVLVQIAPNQKKTNEIIDALSTKSLSNLVSQTLETRWAQVYPFLKDVAVFTPLENFAFWLSTTLNWNKDLTSQGQINPRTLYRLVHQVDNTIFATICELNTQTLSEVVFQQLTNHWKSVATSFCDLVAAFPDQQTSLWKSFNLEASHFNPRCQIQDTTILNLIRKRSLNLIAFKSVTGKLLHQWTFDLLLERWKANLAIVRKIKHLNLSFDLNETLKKSTFNLGTDFDNEGRFSKQGLKHLTTFSITDLIRTIKELNYVLFDRFLQQQMLLRWKELQPYFQKLAIFKSNFFISQLWKDTGLLKTDYDEDFFLQKHVLDEISNRELAKLKCFFSIETTILTKLIVQAVGMSWQEKRPILSRIAILNKEKLLNLTEWQNTQLVLEVDLQSDFNLYLSALENSADWSIKQLLAINKLTPKFLTKVFFQIFDTRWETLVPILKTVKTKQLNFSGQDFWFLTNLNWNTDLQADGYLTALARKNVLRKTPSQIEAIRRLNADKIQLALDLISQKVASGNLKRTGIFKTTTFWMRLKAFFGFLPMIERSLQERLEQKVSLNRFELQHDLHEHKDYKTRIDTLKNLRKKYSKPIVEEGKIVALAQANIQPNRYVVEIEAVSKYFLTQNTVNQVIHKINLKIKRGDFVVILGPSGAGKSTVLNLISGITNPDGGDLFVNGINLTLLDNDGLTEFRRNYVSFVFQQYNLLQNLTAKENIDIVAALLPKGKKSLDMQEILKFLQIESLVNKYPFQLSGGEQQRFAIARALSKNPEVLFCDEPTGALDQEMSRKVMQILFEVNRRYKTTIVLVTHNRIFAQIAKTIVSFVNGKVARFEENKKPVEPKDISFYY